MPRSRSVTVVPLNPYESVSRNAYILDASKLPKKEGREPEENGSSEEIVSDQEDRSDQSRGDTGTVRDQALRNPE